jgi:hypothetical protein
MLMKMTNSLVRYAFKDASKNIIASTPGAYVKKLFLSVIY